MSFRCDGSLRHGLRVHASCYGHGAAPDALRGASPPRAVVAAGLAWALLEAAP